MTIDELRERIWDYEDALQLNEKEKRFICLDNIDYYLDALDSACDSKEEYDCMKNIIENLKYLAENYKDEYKDLIDDIYEFANSFITAYEDMLEDGFFDED